LQGKMVFRIAKRKVKQGKMNLKEGRRKSEKGKQTRDRKRAEERKKNLKDFPSKPFSVWQQIWAD